MGRVAVVTQLYHNAPPSKMVQAAAVARPEAIL